MRVCLQWLVAVTKLSFVAVCGCLWCQIFFCSTLLRRTRSRMQGRWYEEGNDIVHVTSFDAFRVTLRLLLQAWILWCHGLRALARIVAQIRMMRVCFRIKMSEPAMQTWGFWGGTAAKFAGVSYVIRRHRCYNWFVGDCSSNGAGAAGQCLISYGATCQWKSDSMHVGGRVLDGMLGNFAAFARVWRYVWDFFVLATKSCSYIVFLNRNFVIV